MALRTEKAVARTRRAGDGVLFIVGPVILAGGVGAAAIVLRILVFRVMGA